MCVYVSAGIEVLARTWGLFGGALDSPQPQDMMDTDTPPPLSEPSNNGTTYRRAVVEVAENPRVRSDGDEGAPRLHASVPVRATPPHVVDLIRKHQPELSESLPTPPLRADDDDHRSYCSASSELTMDFAEEPESQRPEAATAGQGVTESWSGERCVRCDY